MSPLVISSHFSPAAIYYSQDYSTFLVSGPSVHIRIVLSFPETCLAAQPAQNGPHHRYSMVVTKDEAGLPTYST